MTADPNADTLEMPAVGGWTQSEKEWADQHFVEPKTPKPLPISDAEIDEMLGIAAYDEMAGVWKKVKLAVIVACLVMFVFMAYVADWSTHERIYENRRDRIFERVGQERP